MTYSTSPTCRQSITVSELLAKTIKTDTGCLEWQMTKTNTGYGQIWLRGKMILAHREMTTLIYGQPFDKAMALHSCDNPSCINPEHLSWGTHSENMKQMHARGRAPERKPHVSRRLTYEIAQQIRQQYANGGITLKQIGLEYGLSGKAIEDIVKFKTYKK